MEKMNAVNERYQLLRSKLEAEWRDNLDALERDRITELRNYQNLEKRLDDLNFKLERYKVEDENLRLDRWALDSNLYYRK
mgnify:CR=1 FL=1